MTVGEMERELSIEGLDVFVREGRGPTFSIEWCLPDSTPVGEATIASRRDRVVWTRFIVDQAYRGRGIFTAALQFCLRHPQTRWQIVQDVNSADFYKTTGFVDDPATDMMTLDPRRAFAWLSRKDT